MVDTFKDNNYKHDEIDEQDKKFIRKWKYQIKLARESFAVDNYPQEFSTDKVRIFAKYVPANQYPKILAVGCGWGGEIKELQKQGYENVAGITLGAENVKQARDLLNLMIYEMDMHNMTFSNNSFDGIYCSQAFEHALSPHLCAIEMHRILRMGGIVHIEVPYPNAGEETNKIRDYPFHYGNLYDDLIRSIFERVGFQEIVKDNTDSQLYKYTFFFRKVDGNKHHIKWSE